jgi:hypothetical protein
MASREVHEREEREHGNERQHRRDENVLRPKSIINRCENECLVEATEKSKSTEAEPDDGGRESETSEGYTDGVKEGLESAKGDVEEGKKGVVDHCGYYTWS